MADTGFVPTIYVKHACPFSMKVRLLLLEAGLQDRVNVVQGQTPDEHQNIADRLVEHIGKASFPSAEIAPGQYLAESDALVSHFAGVAGVDPDKLPTFQAYAGGIMPKLQQLYRENMELRAQRA